jgi:hypothetical protein
MTQQIINLGTGPDTSTGDSLYTAFTKVNDNFYELYTVFDGNGITTINANVIYSNNVITSSNVRAGNLFAYGNLETVGYIVTSGVFYPNGAAVGSLSQIDSNLIPTTSNLFSVGSTESQFLNGYFSNILTAGELLVSGGGNFGSNVSVTGNLEVSGNVTALIFKGNFEGNISGNITAAGSDTQVLYNNQGQVAGDTGFRYDSDSKTVVAQNFNAGTSNIFIVNGQRVGVNVASFIDGATLQINGTDSILLPVGDSDSRPGNAQPGMLRFNTVLSDIEYFNGDYWAAPITQFTLSVANAQPGTGSQTVFDLPVGNATTAGTIVSINGIVQQPVMSYSITGNTVTFTEAPSPEDVIDFRIFTTTSTLTALTDVYGTTGVYLDETVGSHIIEFRNNNQQTLTLSANGQAHFTRNISSDNYQTGAMVVDGGIGVRGNVNINGIMYAVAKNFLIEHPSKKDYNLQYSCLEGPEYGVYLRGKISNANVIELPAYWRELIDQESVTVSLTPYGDYQELFVARIEDNTVHILSRNNETINCFYVVYGERKDLDKLIVEYKR